MALLQPGLIFLEETWPFQIYLMAKTYFMNNKTDVNLIQPRSATNLAVFLVLWDETGSTGGWGLSALILNTRTDSFEWIIKFDHQYIFHKTIAVLFVSVTSDIFHPGTVPEGSKKQKLLAELIEIMNVSTIFFEEDTHYYYLPYSTSLFK